MAAKKVKRKSKPKPKSKSKPKPSELDILLQGTNVGLLENQPEVLVVPTRFVGLNRATGIGGVPASSVILIYGPSQGGKTAFALGLAESFQSLGHLVVYIDAEHTLDKTWAAQCGIDLKIFGFKRPETYEETVKEVQKVFSNFDLGRNKGQIHPSRALIVIVDSINKLVPEEELNKKPGRGFPLRALFNTEWMDRAHITIHKLPILFCILAHEKKKMDAKKFERAERIKGGSGLYYDSTLVVQIKTRKVIRAEVKGATRKVELAHVHEGWVEKNKVGVCHEYFKFFMSTGREIPIGFDIVREVMDEAELRGTNSPLIRKTGAIWNYPKFENDIKGDIVLRNHLRENPKLLESIIEDLNSTALEMWDVTDKEKEEPI